MCTRLHALFRWYELIPVAPSVGDDDETWLSALFQRSLHVRVLALPHSGTPGATSCVSPAGPTVEYSTVQAKTCLETCRLSESEVEPR
jgi:hypothetical protein